MGYESKLYIVESHKGIVEDENGLWYGRRIAEIDLSKAGIPQERFFTEKADCYLYADDGNAKITEDCYGDKLTVCTDLPGFIAWMKEQESKEHYRRWGMAIALLEAIKPEDWRCVQVLHYGH